MMLRTCVYSSLHSRRFCTLSFTRTPMLRIGLVELYSWAEAPPDQLRHEKR